MTDDLVCYEKTTLESPDDLTAFAHRHAHQTGTWARLQVLKGEVSAQFIGQSGVCLAAHVLTAGSGAHLTLPPAVALQLKAVSEEIVVDVSWFCRPHHYFEKKYQLSNVHDDLLLTYLHSLQDQPIKTILDIGCGTGRNLLFLAKMGHRVTGIENKSEKLARIETIASREGLDGVTLVDHDLHERLPFQSGHFDWVIATVSLQFIQPDRIDALLSELGEATAAGGFHYLVLPVASEIFSYPGNFTYLPARDALFSWYQSRGWAILNYRVHNGQLSKTGADGKPIQGQFLEVLVQKLAASPSDQFSMQFNSGNSTR
jgi:tellurite methyltransferase